jgi:protein-disulfide isomerase
MDIKETIVEMEMITPKPPKNWFARTWQGFLDGWSFEHLAVGRPQFFSITLPLYVIAIAIILSSAIIAGTFVSVQRSAIEAAMAGGAIAGTQGAGTGQNQGQAQAVNASAVSIAGDPYIGNPNAPVTMLYWSDYQCPYCKQFETTIFPQIVSNYVSTGKLKVVFKDFQFLGPDSLTDAEIARAVWQLYPGQFYQWRAMMYKNQASENHNPDPSGETNALNLTKTISGIDVTKVAALVAQNKTQFDAAIQADQTDGAQVGVQGTPSFVIGNGNAMIVGGQSYLQFSAPIDAALKK